MPLYPICLTPSALFLPPPFPHRLEQFPQDCVCVTVPCLPGYPPLLPHFPHTYHLQVYSHPLCHPHPRRPPPPPHIACKHPDNPLVPLALYPAPAFPTDLTCAVDCSFPGTVHSLLPAHSPTIPPSFHVGCPFIYPTLPFFLAFLPTLCILHTIHLPYLLPVFNAFLILILLFFPFFVCCLWFALPRYSTFACVYCVCAGSWTVVPTPHTHAFFLCVGLATLLPLYRCLARFLDTPYHCALLQFYFAPLVVPLAITSITIYSYSLPICWWCIQGRADAPSPSAVLAVTPPILFPVFRVDCA